MAIEWILTVGLGVIISLLAWIGNILYTGLEGVRKDLAGFQVSTEKRLSAAETTLEMIRVRWDA